MLKHQMMGGLLQLASLPIISNISATMAGPQDHAQAMLVHQPIVSNIALARHQPIDFIDIRNLALRQAQGTSKYNM